MTRITDNMLREKCHVLNILTGNPMARGVGNFHIDYGYGAQSLVQTVNENGGISVIIPSASTKRELADLMTAYTDGMEQSLRHARGQVEHIIWGAKDNA